MKFKNIKNSNLIGVLTAGIFFLVFLVMPNSASASFPTCSGGYPPGGMQCGLITGYIVPGQSKCSISGKANQGGQTCNTGDSASGVSDANDAMTFSKQQISVPTITGQPDPGDPYDSSGFYPGQTAIVTVGNPDDNGSLTLGSNISWSYNGCTCKPTDVTGNGCGATAGGATVSGTVNPDDTLNLSVTNACKPNDNMSSHNTSGVYGSDSASINVQNVTRCYNANYWTWYAQFTGNSAYKGLDYEPDPSINGQCDLVGYTPPPPPPPAVPVVTLSATPISGPAPLTTTLTWTVSGVATTCFAGGGSFAGQQSTSGGTETISGITSQTTFSLYCINAGGNSVTKTVTVSPTVVVNTILSCSPLNQTLSVGQTGNFSVTEIGSGSGYTWSTIGGNTSSGSGNNFSTSYSSPGSYQVNLNDSAIDGPAECTVIVQSAPINGACGSGSGFANSKIYPNGATNFGSDNFCQAGSVNSTPAFPSAGNTVTWGCNGANGGSSTVSNACSASQSAPTITPINGACGPDSGSTFSSLSSGSYNLCANGTTVVNFSGSGPWTWGCNGLNNGTNDSSCHADKSGPFIACNSNSQCNAPYVCVAPGQPNSQCCNVHYGTACSNASPGTPSCMVGETIQCDGSCAGGSLDPSCVNPGDPTNYSDIGVPYMATFTGTVGGATPASQNLEIINGGNIDLNWSTIAAPGDTGTWCHISPASGSVGSYEGNNWAIFTVSVDSPTSVGVGTHTNCGFLFGDPNADNSGQPLYFTYNVSAPAPTGPTAPTVTGPTTGVTNTNYTFSASSIDPNGNQVRYGFDWDKDGVVNPSDWLPAGSTYVNSGTLQSDTNSWSNPGTYTFQVLSQNYLGLNSAWTPFTITISNPVYIPNISLSAAPTTIAPGGTTVLTWSTSNNPTSCVGATSPTPGPWDGSKSVGSGFQVIAGITNSSVFGLTCTNSAGSSFVTVPVTAVTQYSLNITKTYGGSVNSVDGKISCGTTCSHTYNKGDQVTLIPVPDSPQWKFISWTGDCTGNGSCLLNMTSAKNVTAIFSVNPLNYQEF